MRATLIAWCAGANDFSGPTNCGPSTTQEDVSVGRKHAGRQCLVGGRRQPVECCREFWNILESSGLNAQIEMECSRLLSMFGVQLSLRHGAKRCVEMIETLIREPLGNPGEDSIDVHRSAKRTCAWV
jgi:hypothetical protein